MILLTSGGPHSSKSKKAKTSTHKQKVVVVLYSKVCDIVSSIAELLEIQLLTDTTILQVLTSSSALRFRFIVAPSECRAVTCLVALCARPLGVQSGDYTILCGERQ